MNITFLIGNGFDVGMGLRSKFSQYFPLYIEESKNKHNSIKALSDNIDSNRTEWSYFEKKLGEYTKNFTLQTKNDFIAQVKDFELGFISYLHEEEGKLNYDSKLISDKFRKSLLNFYRDNNLNEGSTETITNQFMRYSHDNKVFNFIDYNYTNVLEKCLSAFSQGILERLSNGYVYKIGNIIHVHGIKNNLPIMGVNDSSQIENQELANNKNFARLIVKPLLNNANRTNNDKNATNLIQTSNIICIYGMSLGETDKKWWVLIIKWLVADANRQLIIFDYDENYQPSSQFDFINKEDNIISKFNEYVKEDKIDVESLRLRIHIAVHKNIFALNLRKDEREIETEVAVTG